MMPTRENFERYKKLTEENTITPHSRDELIQALSSYALGNLSAISGKSFLFCVDTNGGRRCTITEDSEREDGREESFASVSKAVDSFFVDGKSLTERVGSFSVSPILLA